MHAMILAAGRGERMRPLTDTCPKPLLPVGGKPLMAWHVQALKAAGVEHIVVNHAHLGQQIESYFGDGSGFGVSLQYSPEAQALETAGGIRKAIALLGGKPFLVVNGDVFCDVDFAALMAHSRSWPDGHLAHILLVPNPEHHPKGDFGLIEGRVKARPADGEASYTFSGIGLYHPRLFEGLELDKPTKLAHLLRAAMDQGLVSGVVHSGVWIDVGTPERLRELDARLSGQDV